MSPTNPWSSEEQFEGDNERNERQEPLLDTVRGVHSASTLARKLIEATDTVEIHSVTDIVATPLEKPFPRSYSSVPAAEPPRFNSQALHATIAPDTAETPSLVNGLPIDAVDTQKQLVQRSSPYNSTINAPYPPAAQAATQPHTGVGMKRGQAILFIALLCTIVFQAMNAGLSQVTGAQGWAYVLGGSDNTTDPNLLKNVGNQLHNKTGTGSGHTRLTPQQYIDLIMQHMTPDQKLGQLMIIQFIGPSYSLDLSTMLQQYGAGAVLIFAANNNIIDKTQLKNLIAQMQQHSALPLSIAIDQEGGRVDRLVDLDGPRPAATTLGATNDPSYVMQAGARDASDLASYGINLNLAPVVDVNNVYNSQMYLRTFGQTADQVTQMAGAYLQGLQQSGKVLGTLKHFPGLGDVAEDPHTTVPVLTRTKNQLEQIDWAPYRQLIKQGNAYTIMVTHEIVQALDPTMPSSLSSKIVQGILRDEMGFQGVIMTDSLTMDALTAYYTEGPAAALAIEAGCDLLMGASTPADVATMVEGIKQAISSGALTWNRINESVRRVLMMKYEMGLLPIPKS